MKCKSLVIANSILIAILFLHSDLTWAEPKLPPLAKGMLYGEVVNYWGNPREKNQEELKGLDIWQYGNDAEVVFKDGKVVTWKDPRRAEMPQIATIKPIDGITSNNKKTSLAHDNPQVVEEILSEIMKEPSSGDSGSAPPSPGMAPPNVVRPIEPMMPDVIN